MSLLLLFRPLGETPPEPPSGGTKLGNNRPNLTLQLPHERFDDDDEALLLLLAS